MSRFVKAKIFDDVLVASTGNVESEVLPIGWITTLESLVISAVSETGDADVMLEFATSPDGVNFEHYDDTTPITTSTLTDKSNGPELYNPFFMSAVPYNLYIKFRVTGVNSNPADTQVTILAILREGEQ